MNKFELRTLRLSALCGDVINHDVLVPFVEDIEDALDEAETDDTSELAAQVEHVQERLEQMAQDRDEWRQEAIERAEKIKGLEARMARAERAEDLELEVQQLRRRLHEMEAERDRLASEACTLTVSRLAGFLLDQAETYRKESRSTREEVDAYRGVNFNGAPVTYDGATLFVPLPRALWRDGPFPGKCRCGKCTDGDGKWDTMAIRRNPRKDESQTAWLVHRPHGRR